MIGEILSILASFITELISTLGYFGVFIAMTLESTGIPLPSEIIMPFSGFLVNEGTFNFWLVVMVGTLANLVGSLIAYAIGKYGGIPCLERWGKYLLISHRDIVIAHRWFEKHGDILTFGSRMLPAVRTYVSFPAGVAEMNIWKFSFYTVLGSFPFVWFLTWLGVRMGENWDSLKVYFHSADAVIGIGLLILIGLFIWRHLKH